LQSTFCYLCICNCLFVYVSAIKQVNQKKSIMEHPWQDSQFKIGLFIYGISVLFFLFPLFTSMEVPAGLFIVHFILFFAYRMAIWEGWRKFPNRNRNILLLLIGNVSAYSLNRSLEVFPVSANWLSAFLVVLNIAMLLYCFRKQLPDWVQYSTVGILGAGLIFHIYEAIYLSPFYPFSIIAAPFFLISLHTLIPLWWSVLLIKMLTPYFKKESDFRTSLWVGLLLPLFLIAGYVTQWHSFNTKIEQVYTQANYSEELPAWVRLSRVIDDNWMSRKILKIDRSYFRINMDFTRFVPFSNGRGKKHDPFIAIASLFSTPLSLRHKQKTHLLNAVYNQRHSTERKFWSGKDLRTDHVETTIEFFPEYRLAYTEKVIDIKKENPRGRSRQQEALYTFYLPEGSVITSASLWVEGEERPSFLTTRNKANSAYAAIVGRERRDPLLLHWKEGNRVTVRVFPVQSDLPRKFKIGITTPLQEKDGQLTYHNPDFDGPYWEDAHENIRILGAADELSFLSKLKFKKKEGEWIYDGDYHSDWSITLDAGLLSKETFSFDGQHFQLVPYQPSTTTFHASEIYLDINRNWSKRQFRKIWELVKDRKVFVYTHKLVQLTPENKDGLFKQLRAYRYNLFPFHLISDPATALVITQSKDLTPVLDDLKGSRFSDNMSNFFQTHTRPIKVVEIGESPSLYLNSLKELRSIQVYATDITTLTTFLNQDIFIANIEDDQLMVFPEMGFGIQEVKQPTPASNAPDHLMRLFTYNQLMREIGRDYFGKEKLADRLVSLAERAYVVSPVSSLLVLETQADYDRFNIKRSKNSLKNASIKNSSIKNASGKNSGSVPEPHEWLLIGLGLLVVLLLRFKL